MSDKNLLYRSVVGTAGELKFTDEIFRIKSKINCDGHEHFNLDIISIDKKVVNKDLSYVEFLKYIHAICEVKTTINKEKTKFELNGTSGNEIYIMKRFGIPVCLGIARLKEKLPKKITNQILSKTVEEIKDIGMEFYPSENVNINFRENTISVNKKDAIVIEDFGGIRPELNKEQKRLIKFGTNNKNKVKLDNINKIIYLKLIFNSEYYYELGLYDEANKYAFKAVEMHPKHPMGYQRMWMHLYKMDRFDEALDFIDKAIELDDTNIVEFYFQRSLTLFMLGRFRQAKESCKKGIKIDSNHKELKRLLKEINSEIENYIISEVS